MKGLLRLFAGALVMALVMSSSTASAYYYTNYTNYTNYSNYSTATSTTTATASSTVAQTLLTLLNKERTQRGLKPLQSDATMASLAQKKSQDMVLRNYFSHTSPTYGSPAQMLIRAGVTYRSWAENIAMGRDAYTIHASWMNSSTHRANILNPNFTHVGVGAAAYSGGYKATQLFVLK